MLFHLLKIKRECYIPECRVGKYFQNGFPSVKRTSLPLSFEISLKKSLKRRQHNFIFIPTSFYERCFNISNQMSIECRQNAPRLNFRKQSKAMGRHRKKEIIFYMSKQGRTLDFWMLTKSIFC